MGALHDATTLARVVPAVMLACSSIRGVSHSPDEDTREEHVVLAVLAYTDLVATLAGTGEPIIERSLRSWNLILPATC